MAGRMITLLLLPIAWAAFYQIFRQVLSCSSLAAHFFGFAVAYGLTYLETVPASKKEGLLWRKLQLARFWKRLADYFPCSVHLQQPLNHQQQYIFCAFPHGACSLNHVITMTNCCHFLSEHYKGDRRDLAASILHWIPFFKDILLFLGCVDAGAPTAKYNLNKGRSILIYVGGEKEQLMTRPGEQKIYLKHRKGFIKLALQYGAHLVPMYCFGENEALSTSNTLHGFRAWLQHKFSVGICIFWGRWGLLPYQVPLRMEVGAPIPVAAKNSADISDSDIESLHEVFVKAMKELFDSAKVRYPEYAKAKLEIL